MRRLKPPHVLFGIFCQVRADQALDVAGDVIHGVELCQDVLVGVTVERDCQTPERFFGVAGLRGFAAVSHHLSILLLPAFDPASGGDYHSLYR